MNNIPEITRREKVIRSLPAFVFKNEHGEQFNIYADSTTVYIGGSEVEMMVPYSTSKIGDDIICLFNHNFNIYTREEMYRIGEGLMALYAPDKKGKQDD